MTTHHQSTDHTNPTELGTELATELARELGAGKLADSHLMQRLLAGRRTAHEFASTQPSNLPDIIRQGIDLARWAPNHGLTEPWDFYHLGRQSIEKIVAINTANVREKKGDSVAAKKKERWLSMPEWLLVTQQLPPAELRTSKPQKYAYVEREDYAACACAIQNLMLYCHSQGMDSKWSTGEVTRSDSLYDVMALDRTTTTIIGIIWIGVSAKPSKLSPRRRRTLDDVYHPVT